MKKRTKGIVLGSLAVGFAGGVIAIRKCLKHKDTLTDKEKVEFKYLGKQGVSDVLSGMSDDEVHELATALEVVEMFDLRVMSQRAEMLSKVVDATLGLDYSDFMDTMLNMYDSDEDILNEPFYKLIDEYYEITGENIEADGEETATEVKENLKAVDALLKKGATEEANAVVESMKMEEPTGDFKLENYMNKPEDK